MSGITLKNLAETRFERQARESYARGRAAGLKPDSPLTVSEWADKNRVLSQKAASEPGRWRTARTPYLREIMDCLSSSSDVRDVVFMKGAQIGATEAGNNWIGYVIDLAPGPMLAVQPTVETAKRNSKQRIAPLIEESAALRDKVTDNRGRRDSGNTILAKEFPGGFLVMTGANSAVGLRSMPARYLFLDEVDGYPGDIEGEGDPIALAKARSRTFSRRKCFMVSTPTIKGLSRIEREYEASDQRYFFCPCPQCGHFQRLQFARLQWPKGKPQEARYICEQNGCVLGDEHKTEMLTRGEWRATAPGPGKAAGFHLSSLYSPVGWLSWVDIAVAWEQAQHNQDLLKGFINTVLGETWQDRGEAADFERLYERREHYRGVPAGVLLLTAGADVQKDRIEVSVWGWGERLESWLIEHRVFMGDTARGEVWKKLDEFLTETWEHASGVEMALAQFAIDEGTFTQEVRAWVRRQRPGLVMGVKGEEHLPMAVGAPVAADITIGGKRLRRGAKFWPVGVSLLKGELYGWLRQPAPEDGEAYPRGYVHLPRMVDKEWCAQLVSEQLVTLKTGRRQWQKLRERNEALDCRNYARAAAVAAGIDRFAAHHWAKLRARYEQVEPEPEPPPSPPWPAPGAVPKAPQQRNSWLGDRQRSWLR